MIVADFLLLITVFQIITMEIDSVYSLVPVLHWSFPRAVSRDSDPSFPKQNRQSIAQPREIAAFTYNPGEPRGIYNDSSKMTYPATNAVGRIVNIYV